MPLLAWAASTCGGTLSSSVPRYGTKYTDTNQLSTSAITVTAKMAKVYSPVVDLARPMGKKPAAVISVPVSIGMAVIS
ncbi:hypothetical protein D3C71_837230 [compost metagenome]